MAELTVTDLDIDDAAWRRIVETATGTSPFHEPRLVQAAASLTGCQLVALGAWRESLMVGGIAAVVSPGGAVLPRSLAAYNGPLIAPIAGASPQTRHRHEAAIAGALLDELTRRHPRCSLRMRPNTFDIRKLMDHGWTASQSFTYHLDIRDLDTTWSRIATNRRRLVRRAEQRAFEVREVHDVTPDLVDLVARLHDEQQGSYGANVDLDAAGWRLALPALVALSSGRLFVTVDAGGGLAAFVLVSGSAPSAAVLASGAARSTLDDGAAALLRWEVIRRLSADGVEVLDLNGARSGPHGRFKASFGGELAERWELRSPEPVPSWWSIPRRAVGRVRSDVRQIRQVRQ